MNQSDLDEKAAKEYATEHVRLHGIVHKKEPSMYGDAHLGFISGLRHRDEHPTGYVAALERVAAAAKISPELWCALAELDRLREGKS